MTEVRSRIVRSLSAGRIRDLDEVSGTPGLRPPRPVGTAEITLHSRGLDQSEWRARSNRVKDLSFLHGADRDFLIHGMTGSTVRP